MHKILYIQYTDPSIYPSIVHSAEILYRRGWGVRVLGLRVSSLPFSPLRAIRFLRMPNAQPGFFQKIHYAVFTCWVVFEAAVFRPRWVYISDPLAAFPGRLAAMVSGARMVYHEHDALTKKHRGFFADWIGRRRLRLARRAEITLFPHEDRLRYFEKETGPLPNALCVRNMPSAEDIRPNTAGQKVLRLHYHGNIGPVYLPKTLFQAIAESEGVEMNISGYETLPGQKKALEHLIREVGAGEKVRLSGLVPRPQMLDHCAVSDVGVAFMRPNPEDVNTCYMAGASNKPFEYMACGLALLVADVPEWKDLFVKPGFAFYCDTTRKESIAAALRQFVEQRAQTRRMGEMGQEKILKEWNYEKEFSGVVARLESESV